MNHFLHQISWHQYLTVTLIAAIVYYFLIIFHNYRPELQSLQRRLTGERQANHLEALQYRSEEKVPVATQPDPAAPLRMQEIITETDILSVKLKACIMKAADKPFAPAILTPQLKRILQEHQPTAVTERPAINHLVVVECEKTGTALLTEKEVDQWWER